MSDVFYAMSKVTIKPVVNYTVLQIFLINSLNFTLVVAFCTVAGNISHTFTPRTLGLFKCIVYLYLVPFLNLTFLLLCKFIGGLTKSIIPALLLCLYIKQLILGTPMLARTAVERCQCATSLHIICEISSSYARFLYMSGHNS